LRNGDVTAISSELSNDADIVEGIVDSSVGPTVTAGIPAGETLS